MYTICLCLGNVAFTNFRFKFELQLFETFMKILNFISILSFDCYSFMNGCCLLPVIYTFVIEGFLFETLCLARQFWKLYLRERLCCYDYMNFRDIFWYGDMLLI